MRLLILYQPNAEHTRTVENFIKDFQAGYDISGVKVQVCNLNTRDGVATASLYDVLRYPAILVTTNDGMMVKCWEGADLPLMDEVAGYLRG